jgi:hypothetical protein
MTRTVSLRRGSKNLDTFVPAGRVAVFASAIAF